VTTPALGHGRPSATDRPLTGTPSIRAGLLAIGLFAASAVPALAAPLAVEPQDPTDIGPALMAPQAGADALSFHMSSMYIKDMRTLFNSEAIGIISPTNTVAEEKSEGRIQRMIKRGLALLGTPYRWGGTSPEKGFDCSGLVGYVYRNTLGIELPRISRDMANVGELIRDRDSLQQGDLVFFSRRGGRVDHVGIYLGEGNFLHAPRTGKDVEITTLASGYWSNHFLKGRRVAPSDLADASTTVVVGSEMAVAKVIDAGAALAKPASTKIQ
jgi:NlpC/P60 family